MVIEVAIIVHTLWRQCAAYMYVLEGVGVLCNLEHPVGGAILVLCM